MSEPHVLISIPTRDNIHAETVGWLLNSMADAKMIGLEMAVHIICSPYPLELQRNTQISDFLEKDRSYTHLFLLDSDCVPQRGTIEKLLDYDKDIVASVAPSLIRGNHCFTSAWENADVEDWAERWRFLDVRDEKCHGLQQVDGVGATGVLIKRKVLETMDYPWFKMCFDPEEPKMRMGEDFYFCKKARNLGFEIWADFDLRQKHYKTIAL